MPHNFPKNRTVMLSASVLAWLCCAPHVMAQSTTPDDPLPNFQPVNEQLYRGAQPRDRGMQQLAARGIKTVINLRAADRRAAIEAAAAQRAGLRYFNLPLPGFASPTDEQVASVLALINTPENWPVFVHCKHGADRTGTVIAIYRITHDGWTAEKATQEAERYGMRWVQFEMKGYIADYERRLAQPDDHAATLTPPKQTRTHRAGLAVATTRRALEKSYASTRKSWNYLKNVF